MYDYAGEIFKRMGQLQRALESLVNGHAYREAVELARSFFPNQVVSLEESWGDFLVSSGQVDMAIDHFMEAHKLTKAIDAAMLAKKWSKATVIADHLDDEMASPYLTKLAKHFLSTKSYKEAEKYFLKANEQNEAVL
eukprot:6401877-Ditylum_brightwellii.AAC.1